MKTAAMVGLAVLLYAVTASGREGIDCRCLQNGGHPGPGDCLCDVGQCYHDCVGELCPGTVNCTLECSFRCGCNDAVGCPTHEDPGPTPTPVSIPRTYSVTACYTEIPNSACSAFGVPYGPPSLLGPIPYLTTHTAMREPGSEPYYVFEDLVPGNYVLGGGGCNPFGCRIDSVVTVTDQDVFAVVTMVAPLPSPLFRVCGKAAERPDVNPPLARFAYHTLYPLGVTELSSSSGIFCFHGVPAGDYTITTTEYQGAPSNCTAYGCWQDTPVSVVDADVLDVFIAMDPLPPPTPGPCLGDGDGDRQVTIDELVGAVAHALDGCP
jgi:hypothetical protein